MTATSGSLRPWTSSGSSELPAQPGVDHRDRARRLEDEPAHVVDLVDRLGGLRPVVRGGVREGSCETAGVHALERLEGFLDVGSIDRLAQGDHLVSSLPEQHDVHVALDVANVLVPVSYTHLRA